MKKQANSSDEIDQSQQDRVMRQRAESWLADHRVWHFARVTARIDSSLREEGYDVWFALADALPAQTAGILLTERTNRWEILVYKTVQKIGHTQEVIQNRFELLVAALKSQKEPVWRSDQEEI